MKIMSSPAGKLVAISFVGIVVAAYKFGKYHSATAFTTTRPTTSKLRTSRGSSSSNNKTNEKKQDENDNHQEPTTPNADLSKRNNNEELIESITLKPIGKISSVYRLCVGTPRQGLLAPNSRGRIDLYPDQISSDSIIDLDKYSHLWIVFIFHLNSTSTKERKDKQVSAKISPPALGGKRVGVFATRTPHRPNPVGFSLCKIDKIVIPKKKKHCKAKDQPYSVYVSGLDLVDGTPVLDIKPYVPHYDSVGYVSNNDDNNRILDTRAQQDSYLNDDVVRIPQWVSEGLDKRRPVIFMQSANEQLIEIMSNSQLVSQLEFYGVHSGRDSCNETALQKLKSCIEEVLSVDVRSSFQTKKARKGEFKAERTVRVSDILAKNNQDGDQQSNSDNAKADISNNNIVCTQQLDHLLIKYSVEANEDLNHVGSAVNTSGSGADDTIAVQEIELINTSKKVVI